MINIVVAHGKVRSSWFQVHYSSRRQVSIYSLLVPYIATLPRRCSSHMSVLTIDSHPADDKISPQLAPSRLDTGELR